MAVVPLLALGPPRDSLQVVVRRVVAGGRVNALSLLRGSPTAVILLPILCCPGKHLVASCCVYYPE